MKNKKTPITVKPSKIKYSEKKFPSERSLAKSSKFR